MKSIAPSTLLIFIVFALLGLSILPALLGSGYVFVWIGAWSILILLAGIDLFLSTSPDEVSFDLVPIRTFYLGEPAKFRVRLRCDSKLEYELRLDVDGDIEPTLNRPFQSEGGSHHADYEVVPLRRGVLKARQIWVRWKTKFGLFDRIKTRPADAEVLVVPNVEAVKRAALQWQQRNEFMSGVHAQKFLSDGSEFDTLRKYVQGMDHRSIDWKASAKHAMLLSRRYQAERNQRLIIAFDTGRLNCEPLGDIPRLDHAINAGLLLGYMSLRIGDQVGIVGFDAKVHTFRKPVSGVRAYHHLTASTAKLEYSSNEPNYTLAMSEIMKGVKRRSIVVIFTEFTDTIGAELMLENLTRLSKKHVVLFVALRNPEFDDFLIKAPDSLRNITQSVVVRQLIMERKKVLKNLSSRGVYVVDCTPKDLSVSLLNRYLELHQRELV